MTNYYDPDIHYNVGAGEFGERPLITDDRGGSELVPERDLSNELFRQGGVTFRSDEEPEFDEMSEYRLSVYAELFEEVFGGGFGIVDISEEDNLDLN